MSRTNVAWALPFPGYDGHTVYVWLDALANYITALGFGADDAGDLYRTFWQGDGVRLHLDGTTLRIERQAAQEPSSEDPTVIRMILGGVSTTKGLSSLPSWFVEANQTAANLGQSVRGTRPASFSASTSAPRGRRPWRSTRRASMMPFGFQVPEPDRPRQGLIRKVLATTRRRISGWMTSRIDRSRDGRSRPGRSDRPPRWRRGR